MRAGEDNLCCESEEGRMQGVPDTYDGRQVRERGGDGQMDEFQVARHQGAGVRGQSEGTLLRLRLPRTNHRQFTAGGRGRTHFY